MPKFELPPPEKVPKFELDLDPDAISAAGAPHHHAAASSSSSPSHRGDYAASSLAEAGREPLPPRRDGGGHHGHGHHGSGLGGVDRACAMPLVPKCGGSGSADARPATPCVRQEDVALLVLYGALFCAHHDPYRGMLVLCVASPPPATASDRIRRSAAHPRGRAPSLGGGAPRHRRCTRHRARAARASGGASRTSPPKPRAARTASPPPPPGTE